MKKTEFLLTVNYSTPTYKRSVCLFFFFLLFNSSDFLALLSPTSLIYHLWTLCNSPKSFPLILMYKISGKTAILWNIFSIC